MAVNLSSLGGAAAQFFDNSGVPLAGGKLHTYATGTTTPQATYTSSSGVTPHANPIILDSAGRVPGGEIWLTDNLTYKFVIETSTGVLLGTYDNVPGIPDIDFNLNLNAANIEYDPPFTGAVTSGYTVEEKLAQSISAVDFGVVGDGVTDNATALTTMRNYMVANPTVAFTVHFPPGFYKYSYNGWTKGIVDLTIDGYGATFQCTTAAVFSNEGIPLTSILWFYTSNQNSSTNPLSSSFNSGYKINTVSAGSTTITLQTLATVSNYAVGDTILVHGFDQQFGGFPPNLRYFEYRKITAINTSTGAITLDTKLKNSYDSQWWDAVDYSDGTPYSYGEGYVGKARALPIKNAYTNITKRMVIKGVTFVDNPNTPSVVGFNYFNIGGVLNLSMIDCNLDGLNAFNATMHDTCRLIGGSYNCDFELDKICDLFQARDCSMSSVNADTFRGLSSAAGVNTVDIQDCVIENRIINLSPRNLVISNNEINNCKDSVTGDGFSVIGSYFNIYPYHSATVENNKIRTGLTYLGTTLFNSQSSSLVITPSVSGFGSNFAITANAAAKTLLVDLDIGQVLTRDDGLYSGTVTSITYNGVYILVNGTWAVDPSTSNSWLFNRFRNQSINNNVVIAGHKFAAPAAYPFTDGNNQNQTQIIRLNSSNNSVATFNSHCLIHRVYCYVSKAYTGTTVDKTLYVRNTNGSPQVMSIDLTTTGGRYLDVFGQSLKGTDTATSANLMTFIERLYATLPIDNATTDAEWVLDIEISPMYG